MPRNRLFLLLTFFVTNTALAQITTTPVAAPIPVPLQLSWFWFTLVLGAVGALALRNRLRGAGVLASVLGVSVVAGAALQVPSLRAQLVFAFTNPAGETLPIPATQSIDTGNVVGFEPADYTNNAGVSLNIASIIMPGFLQCFAGGATNNLLAPGAPDPSPPIACAQNQVLANGQTCRVDVETECRALAAANTATLSVLPATLSFEAGTTGEITATNTSAAVAAQNVLATLPVGVISVESTTCTASLAPGASCTITLGAATPQAQTTITVGGDNTAPAGVEITVTSGVTLMEISPASGSASGALGVTITGTGFTGATSVTFAGVPATAVNVVNSTTITAVTPAHAAGMVDVVVGTPIGDGLLADGFTYLVTSVGQRAGGGIIAGLDGGLLNLIAAVADNSIGVDWSPMIETAANSLDNGAANTLAIVSASPESPPNAAMICEAYEVDSQGNTPCQAGNACYADWFLPAVDQLRLLSTNSTTIGGFAATHYWSSTEVGLVTSFAVNMINDAASPTAKSLSYKVRCTRNFSP